MYVCAYVSTYVYMYIYIYIYIYVYACTHVWMCYVCMYVTMRRANSHCLCMSQSKCVWMRS